MSSFTNMPLKIESGGKVKISSGKASVDKAGITLTMDILHQNNSTAAIVTARYMIGLTSTVTFNGTGDSAPLFKSEVDVDSSVQSTHSFSGFVPNAVANDGVIDCFFFLETTTQDAFLDGIGGFEDEREGSVTVTNSRFGLRIGASPTATITLEDVEWDTA